MSIETPFYDAFIQVDSAALTTGNWSTPNSGAAGDASPAFGLGFLAVKKLSTGRVLVQLERPASALALIGAVQPAGVAGVSPVPSSVTRLSVLPAGTTVGYDGAMYDNTNFREIDIASAATGQFADDVVWATFFRAPSALPASAA